jgi:polyhydroxybutyrate depolymerase
LAALGLALSAGSATAETIRGKLYTGGSERNYVVFVPDSAPPDRRLPLVIALHGPLMTGRSMRTLFGMDEYAEREGFAVAYPDSRGPRWNDGRGRKEWGANDVRFINLLARRLVKLGIADPGRLYLVGLSSGGMLTYRIACETPESFVAYAAVIADMPKRVAKRCRLNTGVPMLIINTLRETLSRYGDHAEWAPSNVLSGAKTLDFWRRANGCDGAPQVKKMPDSDTSDGSTVTAEQYVKCRGRMPLVSFSVEGGGYLPPGAHISNRPLLISVLGRPNRDISAADIAWKFFRRFRAAR